jgi:hypothetical protein
MEPSIVFRMDGPSRIHDAKRPTARKTNGAVRAHFGWEKRAGTKVGAFFRRTEKQTTSRNHPEAQKRFDTKAPTKPETRRRPRAGGDQREPSSSAFCFPAPASLGPGTRRGTPTSESAAGVTRARGAAAAQSPPSPQEPGKTSVAAGRLLTSKTKSFPTRTEKEKAPVNLQARFQRAAKSFWFASAQISDSSGKILGSGKRHPQQYKISPRRRRRLQLQSRTMPKPFVIQ